LGTTKISRFSLFDFFIVDSYIKGQLVRELGVTNYELGKQNVLEKMRMASKFQMEFISVNYQLGKK